MILLRKAVAITKVVDMSSIKFVPATSRSIWPGSDIVSRQSFPATGNFDLEANAFGLLMVHNDDIVAPGEGFDMHFHKDQEIVTWVIEGEVRHRDSGAETATILGPGQAQAISAGSGVSHSEVNANGYTSRKFTRVIQSWLPPDTLGGTPAHASQDFADTLNSTGFVQVIGGDGLSINTSGAAMFVGDLNHAGGTVTLPGGAYIHLYAYDGEINTLEHTLEDGDALRITDHPEALPITGNGKFLAWVMQRDLRTPSA